jgi:hypothetical protein
VSELPAGWSFDPDYENGPAWWHDDCPTPTVLDDGSQIGGIAGEERINGRLVGVVCFDCEDAISVARRPKTAVEAI